MLPPYKTVRDAPEAAQFSGALLAAYRRAVIRTENDPARGEVIHEDNEITRFCLEIVSNAHVMITCYFAEPMDGHREIYYVLAKVVAWNEICHRNDPVGYVREILGAAMAKSLPGAVAE